MGEAGIVKRQLTRGTWGTGIGGGESSQERAGPRTMKEFGTQDSGAHGNPRLTHLLPRLCTPPMWMPSGFH